MESQDPVVHAEHTPITSPGVQDGEPRRRRLCTSSAVHANLTMIGRREYYIGQASELMQALVRSRRYKPQDIEAEVGVILPAGLDRSVKEQAGIGLAVKKVRSWWCLIDNEREKQRDANMMSLLQMAHMTQTSRRPTQLHLTHLTSPLVSPMPILS
jgi:hypothetical protein